MTILIPQQKTVTFIRRISDSPEGLLITNDHIGGKEDASYVTLSGHALSLYGSTSPHELIPWGTDWSKFRQSVDSSLYGRSYLSEDSKTAVGANTGHTSVSGSVQSVRGYCYAMWKKHMGIDREFSRWNKRIARKILAWDKEEKNSPLKLDPPSFTVHMVHRRISRLDLLRVADAIVLEKPVGTDRSFAMKDLERLTSIQLVQLLKYVDYYLQANAPKKGEAPRPLYTEAVKQAFKAGVIFPGMPAYLCGKVELALSAYGAKEVPDTPWHILLWGRLNEYQKSKGAHIIMVRDYWGIWEATRSPARWIEESKPSDLLPIREALGVSSPQQLELIREDATLAWENPLNGVLRALHNLDEDECATSDEYERDLPSIISAAFRYLMDGHAIYTRYKGIKGVDARGGIVKAVPIKGSLSRMVKDALYNHNIERHLLAVVLANGARDIQEPMWVPTKKSERMILEDAELEAKRVKDKRQLVLLGQALRHCVGTRKDTTSALFYWDGGTVVAEVKFGRGYSTAALEDMRRMHDLDIEAALKGTYGIIGKWSVSECHDASNSYTEDSRKFSAWLSARLGDLPNVSDEEEGIVNREEPVRINLEEGPDLFLGGQYSLAGYTDVSTGGISFVSDSPLTIPGTGGSGGISEVSIIRCSVLGADSSELLTFVRLLLNNNHKVMKNIYGVPQGLGEVPIKAEMIEDSPSEVLAHLQVITSSWEAPEGPDYDKPVNWGGGQGNGQTIYVAQRGR